MSQAGQGKGVKPKGQASGPSNAGHSRTCNNPLPDAESAQHMHNGRTTIPRSDEAIGSDEDLKRVVEAWASLSAPVKAAVMALVGAGQGER